jgi:hypothetical protein
MTKLKLTLFALAAAAVLAATAAATPPPGKGKPASTGDTPASTSGAKANVMFVLHGTIQAYTAVSGGTNGSVSLLVSHANHAARSLVGQTLVFTIGSSSKLAQHHGATPAAGDRAIVKLRAPKTSVASLTSTGNVFQLVDQGKAS